MNAEALLIATGQNLKRLLQKRGWGRRPFPGGATGAVLAGFFLFFGVLALVLEGDDTTRSANPGHTAAPRRRNIAA